MNYLKIFDQTYRNKNFLFILIIFAVLSCKQTDTSLIIKEPTHEELHKEMEKVNIEYQKFQNLLTKLYIDAEKNPDKVILQADSLIAITLSEKGKYKSQIKSNITKSLHSLKAELFYKLGKYKESIVELETDNYKSGSVGAT
jgi:hypothetical protein